MFSLKKIFSQTFISLKIYNYRLYFVGQAISLCGTWVQTIGQDWLVLKISGSGTMLGVVSAFQFLPLLLLGPVGGVLADRFPRRKVLYFTQGISGFLALILGFLVFTNTVQIWMICILALCLGLVNTIDNPTRQAFVFDMVSKERIANAVALNSIEFNLARVIGPAIGGGLIAAVGFAACFFINAASYSVVIIVLFLMRAREIKSAPVITKIKGQLIKGLRYVKSTPVLFNVLFMMVIIGTFTYEFTVSLPLLVKFIFNGDATTYATLTTAVGVGAVAGGFFSAGRKRISPRQLVLSAFFFGISMLLASFMPIFLFTLLFLVIVGFFSVNFLSLGSSILQLESAPEMRGRVMSFWTMVFLGSTPIGGPIIGWIGEHFGARWSFATGGIAAVLAAIWGGVFLYKEEITKNVTQEMQIKTEEITDQERRIL